MLVFNTFNSDNWKVFRKLIPKNEIENLKIKTNRNSLVAISKRKKQTVGFINIQLVKFTHFSAWFMNVTGNEMLMTILS